MNAAGNGLTLTRPDGSTALGYTGLTACDATGKTLPASLEVQTDGGPSGTVDPRQRCRGPGPDHHRSVRAGGQAHRVRWRGGRPVRLRRLRSAATRWWSEQRTPRSAATATRDGLRVHGVRLQLGLQTAKLTAVRWYGERLFRQFGCDQRQHGGGRLGPVGGTQGRPTCSRSPPPAGQT